MATVKQIIDLAKKEVGTVEKVSNDVKYNTWYYGKEVNDKKQGGDVYPWCMAFQSWLFDQKKSLSAIGGKSCSCSQTKNWFKNNKRWYKSPKVGDLVFFTYSHIGLVIEVHDGYIITIEGNTSSNDSGSQRNGGMVAKRTRSSSIDGYGRPKYDAEKKLTLVEIKSKCNLYKNKTIVDGKILSLGVGLKVTFIQDMGDGWSKCSFNSSVGYIKNTSLKKAKLSKYKYGEITKLACLRDKNSLKSHYSCKLPIGTSVVVVSIGKSWTQIKYMGKDKFISNAKIKVK